eukprot:3602457-Ditylum_brightwellii.AAC.1
MDDEEGVDGGAVVVIDNADELHAMTEEEHTTMFQKKSGSVTSGAALRVVTDGDNFDTEDLESEEG